MAEVFCNIDNTGTQDGTSFATGFTDIRAAFTGATVGDTVYIGSGSTAYVITGSNVYASNSDLGISTSTPTVHKPFKCIGISGGDTGSVPMGDDRPLILCNRTNGTSVFFPQGSEIENLRFDGEMYTGNNNTTSHLQADKCTLRNVEVKVRDRTDGTMIGDRAMGLSTSAATNLIGCSLISDLSASSFPTRDAGYESVFTIYESNVYDCVFHSKGNAPILSFNRVRASYGNGGQYHNCIFIGSGNETLYTPTGTCHTQSMTAMLAKGCIFYNLSSAVKLNHVPVSTTSSYNTELELQNKIDTLRIHECIFINCNIGAETPSYSDPTGWESGLFTMEHVFRLHKCAFYNNTVSNTSGDLSNILPIQLSADPFVDSANYDFRLNDNPNGGGKLKKNDIEFAANSKIQGRLYGASVLFRGQYDFSSSSSNRLSLGTGDVGDIVTVDQNRFQLVQENPRVWRNI